MLKVRGDMLVVEALLAGRKEWRAVLWGELRWGELLLGEVGGQRGGQKAVKVHDGVGLDAGRGQGGRGHGGQGR